MSMGKGAGGITARFSGHGPLRRRARFDRVELAEQAGITGVEQIRLLARRAIENLHQHVGQRECFRQLDDVGE